MGPVSHDLTVASGVQHPVVLTAAAANEVYAKVLVCLVVAPF
jgi:hypothetical protein